jgi:hypothetical protein
MMRAACIPRRFDSRSAYGSQSNKLPSLRPVVDQNLYSPHPKSGQTSSGFSLPLIVWTRPSLLTSVTRSTDETFCEARSTCGCPESTQSLLRGTENLLLAGFPQVRHAGRSKWTGWSGRSDDTANTSPGWHWSSCGDSGNRNLLNSPKERREIWETAIPWPYEGDISMLKSWSENHFPNVHLSGTHDKSCF